MLFKVKNNEELSFLDVARIRTLKFIIFFVSAYILVGLILAVLYGTGILGV
ncbi:MAG TPA: hypothetical protein VFF33_04340 [Ignavibacteriaceae bacterium]|nr:hypothetical protein [Ignavibacteriaceae bacterium]